MAGNDWVNSYLEAILDVGQPLDDARPSLLLRERGRFTPSRYFVEEVITGYDETDLHRSWVKVTQRTSLFFLIYICNRDGEDAAPAAAAPEEVKKSNHVQRKIESRQEGRTLDSHIEDQFASGRLLACISSRPGQCGRADGYILEGKELEFYQKKIQKKKGKGAA
ncbi:hypothetical protein DY000_02018363 [Brassica cretica]|uniref:40S ribosomal protein S8 n=1 Tax=Brassica cretica TaxID=69181 RepID=A0ABQ7D450_BRACR|nr:hypothetical protein DY000_02018363 [Brassica cretica]